MISKYYKSARNDLHEWNDFLTESKRDILQNWFLQLCSAILLSIAMFSLFPNNYFALGGVILLTLLNGIFSHKTHARQMILRLVIIEDDHDLSEKVQEDLHEKCFSLLEQLGKVSIGVMALILLVILFLFSKDI